MTGELNELTPRRASCKQPRPATCPALSCQRHPTKEISSTKISVVLNQRVVESENTVSYLQLDEPAIFQGGLVHLAGIRLQLRVRLDHLTGDGNVHIRSCLNRLDGSERGASREFGARLGKINVDNIAQSISSVLSNSDSSSVSINL